MSNSTAKATRRDLRRAIGPAATEHVREIEQAIGIMRNGLASCQREIATLAVNHADQNKRVAGCVSLARWEGELAALIAEQNVYTLFMRRPFLARLRWLFAGQ